MSRTRHHINQAMHHASHDYGARFRCNKSYGAAYGKESRNLAHREMRRDAKLIISSSIDEIGDSLPALLNDHEDSRPEVI